MKFKRWELGLIVGLIVLGLSGMGYGQTRIVLARTAIAVAATGVTFDISVSFLSGGYQITGYRATRIVYETCNNTNNVTFTLSAIDANSVTLWTSATFNEATNNSIPVDLELVGTYTFRTTLSGAAGGTGCTAYITILGY